MLTPLDIQKKELKRSFRGYNVAQADGFLDQVVQSYESIYLESQTLKEKLEASEAAKIRYQEMEKIIKDAVIMAQKNADDLEQNARREAEVQLEEARLRAEKIIGEAEEKANRTMQEVRERARYKIEEAEDRIKSLVDEYRYLEKQVNMFRVKFRSFLDAQLSLLDGQEEKNGDLMSIIASDWIESAISRDDSEQEQAGAELENEHSVHEDSTATEEDQKEHGTA